ncbi:MAG: hypothetical protein IT183_12505 [Acidobacteria bacterium]|nr:hypothetical protein [Acidobacteriota bacterium]
MEFLPPPGPERRRQLIRLSFLLVLLAGVLWYWSGPAVPPARTSNQAGAGTPVPAGQLPVPEALALNALRASSELEDAGRNPFVYGERAAAPGTAFLTTPQPGPPPGPAVPPPPPVPQGPPPIPLRLTGLTVVQAGGRTLVTLKDPSTNTLYQAFEGDIVDGRYRVVKVGVQSVVVSYLDGSGIRTLPLGG